LADVSLAMTGHIAAVLAPAQSAEWDRALESLHKASRVGLLQTREAATKLRGMVGALLAAASTHALGKADGLALMARVLAIGGAKAEGDCTAAEQTTYVVGAVSEFLKGEGVAVKSLEADYNSAVDSVNCRRGEFDTDKFKASIARLTEKAAKLK
jgi:hypothetical protein